MKHYLRSTAMFLLVLFMCVSTVFSASHKIYAEPEISTETVLVESTAGNDECKDCGDDSSALDSALVGDRVELTDHLWQSPCAE